MRLHYREWPGDLPFLFLHGGWGYQVYPFDRHIEAFRDRFRILIPDRSGYGQSTRIARLDTRFHWHAAAEMMSFLDGLGIEQTVLWGHSDGAVIAAMMALEAPHRFPRIIMEAAHLYKLKPRSRVFFETMMLNPESLGERVCSVLAADHGMNDWKKVIIMNGHAWLDIARSAKSPEDDLYDGRLGQLSVRTMIVHGRRDPRTEPGELEALHRAISSAELHVMDEGGHSPHSQTGVADATVVLAQDFLTGMVAPRLT